LSSQILITGITGFAGSHLTRLLLDQGSPQIHGTYRFQTNRDRIRPFEQSIELHSADITDSRTISQLVDQIAPDVVYHLAAISHIPVSLEKPRKTYEINFMGTVNLLDALRKRDKFCRVILVGSSAEYGRTAENRQPLRENDPLRPENPYSVSKASMDLLGGQWHQQTGWPVIRTRSFPHTGPGQRDRFACSNFARQIAEIEVGDRELLRVGNLELTRDFLDVRDVVRAYQKLQEAPSGVYNVCSDTGVKLETIVEYLIGCSDRKIPVERSKDRLRENEIVEIAGSNEKIQNETGWEPKISIQKTLEDLLNYWRERIDG